ncbi:MAG: hypothetical protein ACRDG7_18855 [Candidatus Limnocylindria bacterium]
MTEARDGGALPDIDTIRARWRRWRKRQLLADLDAEDFGHGGLARLIPDRTSRLLILPSDPETHLVDLDEEIWDWWASEFDDPATGEQTRWGRNRLPTAAAAVFGDDYGERGWRRYIALHRSGALEVGFGRDGSVVHDEQRYFFLGSIVARCWAAIERYREVIERFDLQAPHELSLALVETEGALLGGFAEGWAEPDRLEYVTHPCRESNILIRRACPVWPDEDEQSKAVALSLGAQIEDAWSAQQRRFLANRGEFEGQFDPRPARWH